VSKHRGKVTVFCSRSPR